MRKLSLTVTEDTYRSARVWATRCNTSISALVRNYLDILNRLPCPGVVAGEEDEDAHGVANSSPDGTSLPL
jgi:hypothetical protein